MSSGWKGEKCEDISNRWERWEGERGSEGAREGKALSRGEIRGLVMCPHHVMTLAALGRRGGCGQSESNV